MDYIGKYMALIIFLFNLHTPTLNHFIPMELPLEIPLDHEHFSVAQAAAFSSVVNGCMVGSTSHAVPATGQCGAMQG